MLPVGVANGLSRLSSPGLSDGAESTGPGVSFPNASGGPPLQPQSRHSRMFNPNQANAAPKKEACPRAFIDSLPSSAREPRSSCYEDRNTGPKDDRPIPSAVGIPERR